jgi:lauroyl/myristoyl acyltransferase
MINPVSAVARRLVPRFVISLCQALSYGQAYRIGGWIANVGAKLNSPWINKIRTSLAVVLGLPENDPRVFQALVGFLKNWSCGYIDLFKALRGGRKKVVNSVHVDPSQIKKIKEYVANGQSVVLVGVHTCGFDFGVIALTEWLPDIQLISMPNPKGENKFMHKMRLKFGLNVTPITMTALRQAVKKLTNGGVVAIANDLLVEDGEMFNLFGHQLPLSTGHARLALRSCGVMVMAVVHKVGRGQYHVVLEEIPQPQSTGDKNQDILNWAESSYTYLEKYIRRWPEEWFGSMFGIFGS